MMQRIHGSSSVFTPPTVAFIVPLRQSRGDQMKIRRLDDKNARFHVFHDMENTQLSLLYLPVEIFLHICSFLDTPTLVYSLSLVCKQFYLILKDDLLWKARINRIWPHASHSLLYPVRPDKLFWMSSCVAIEKKTALWKQEGLTEKLIKVIQYFGQQSLLLMHDGTTCVAGARNGALVYWKLPSREKLPSDEIGNTVCIESADNRWIWDLTAIDNTIYGCSCDQSIKSWMLTSSGLAQQRTYDMDAHMPGEIDELTCVSSCPERSLFATGSYRRTIFVFDSRSHKLIRQYRTTHTGGVFYLAMNTDYIVSASRWDKTVSVWDQRAGRTMKSITVSGLPTCMSMQRDRVCVGDFNAKLHVLNPKNDFELVKSYSTEHKKEITGVHLTHGCLMTSSTDGTVRISSPTDPPQPIATLLSVKYSGFVGIEKMDYLNGTLAITGNGLITVWRPKSKKYQ